MRTKICNREEGLVISCKLIAEAIDLLGYRRIRETPKLCAECAPPITTTSGLKSSPGLLCRSVLSGFSLLLDSMEGVRPDFGGDRECVGHWVDWFGRENQRGFTIRPLGLNFEWFCNAILKSLTMFITEENLTIHYTIPNPAKSPFSAWKIAQVCFGIDLYSLLAWGVPLMGVIWTFCEETGTASTGNRSKSIPASVLLRKLRWSTLGLQFDWSKLPDHQFITVDYSSCFFVTFVPCKRNYDVSLPHNKIPDALAQLAKKMAAPAMPLGQEFQPEAAIVNYFGLGDTLGGHLDNMEADWSKPIVSMSLGCKAIFLLGGKSRQDLPQPMFLRSGDVVLMAGEARECFHGVPRIFTDEENSEMTPLELQLSHPDDICYLEYVRKSRININIRQVF
ncbi:hypothetical protein RHMOL_Rhmol12G0113200 [Rhododendron molle]|uniref:Uncharacterized protein n=1 Tax=Rhododendron molle TaxID=49168 RepID=A0ACC0LGQ8_RHOML|nr:hypothetical protein RHMOL_Rhmol12G0113200 [Rhododendron molle]